MYLFHSRDKAKRNIDDDRFLTLLRPEIQPVVCDCEGTSDCAWIGEGADIGDLYKLDNEL